MLIVIGKCKYKVINFFVVCKTRPMFLEELGLSNSPLHFKCINNG
jgi:hypothetical protein